MDDELSQLAQRDQIELLYQTALPATFTSLLVAVLICIALSSVQSIPLLSSWFILILISVLIRLRLFDLYQHYQRSFDHLLRWRRLFLGSVILSALIWGIGAVVIMPAEISYQILIYSFLVGMAGGAIAVYASDRCAMLSVINALLLPSSFWFLVQNNTQLFILALGGAIFILIAFQSSHHLSNTLYRSFYLSHQLKRARDQAEITARQDELTGLDNRRAFYEKGRLMMQDCPQQLLAMIMVDVDYFKKINDHYGHHIGDMVLKKAAQLLRTGVRSTDLCARFGGEEFAILLPVYNLEKACWIAEKLRRRLERCRIEVDEEVIQITASFGVAIGGCDLEKLINQADSALYQAKREGRNRVACYS